LEANENKIPDWLKNLQENSWELELLVSGGAIFSLFQLSDLFLDWINNLKTIALLPGIGMIVIVGMLGIKLLTTGFMLHLIFRAFWLGLVCINYVFPGGINGSGIKLKKPFKTTHTDGDLKEQIMRVDKYCGIIMYTSIISAIVIAGLIFLIFVSFGILYSLLLSVSFNVADIFAEFSVYFMLLYILDLLVMGGLRKIPFLSFLLFPVFKFFDILSLRSIYERSLSLFSTNIHKWKFRFAALIFVAFSITTTYLAIYRMMHWPNIFDNREMKWNMADNHFMSYAYYRDENSEFPSSCSIQSKIIDANYLDLFVKYERRYDVTMPNDLASDKNWLTSLLVVNIDDSVYQTLEWFPLWNEDIYNIGVNTMIDISHLGKGKHELRVNTDSTYIKPEEMEHQYFEVVIPFWKDVN
jgi:hypothetical protein